jgi:hypothetical protein
MKSYCTNQREAVLLTCPKCGCQRYVTNAPPNWVCAECRLNVTLDSVDATVRTLPT